MLSLAATQPYWKVWYARFAMERPDYLDFRREHNIISLNRGRYGNTSLPVLLIGTCSFQARIFTFLSIPLIRPTAFMIITCARVVLAGLDYRPRKFLAVLNHPTMKNLRRSRRRASNRHALLMSIGYFCVGSLFRYLLRS